MTITADQVRTAMRAANITRVPHHDCSICGQWVAYEYVPGEDLLYFNASCDCGWSEPRRISFEDAAEFINMQTLPTFRHELLKRFGLPADA